MAHKWFEKVAKIVAEPVKPNESSTRNLIWISQDSVTASMIFQWDGLGGSVSLEVKPVVNIDFYRKRGEPEEELFRKMEIKAYGKET